MSNEETRASMLELCWVSALQHLVLTVCHDWLHLSQNKFLRYPTNTESLCDANLTKISMVLISKLFFRDKFSRYFRTNLLQASIPSSEKDFKPYPELVSQISCSECSRSLCRVGVMLAQGNESNTKRYVSLHNFPKPEVFTNWLEFKIFNIAAS